MYHKNCFLNFLTIHIQYRAHISIFIRKRRHFEKILRSEVLKSAGLSLTRNVDV